MYKVIFLRKNKVFQEEEFMNLEDAEHFIYDTYPEYHCDYQIVDLDTGDVLDEGELESTNEIFDTTIEIMNPNGNEDS
jgi:hypothetical protein